MALHLPKTTIALIPHLRQLLNGSSGSWVFQPRMCSCDQIRHLTHQASPAFGSHHHRLISTRNTEHKFQSMNYCISAPSTSTSPGPAGQPSAYGDRVGRTAVDYCNEIRLSYSADADHFRTDGAEQPKRFARRKPLRKSLTGLDEQNRKYSFHQSGLVAPGAEPDYEAMLGEIVDRLKRDETPITIMGSTAGMDTPMMDLHKAGLNPGQIVDFFHARPELLGTVRERWAATLSLFVGHCGYNVEAVLEMVARDPKLLNLDSEQVFLVLNALQSLNLTSENVQHMTRADPSIFSLDPMFIRTQVNELREFFTMAQLNYVLRHNPGILFRNADDLREIYEYIYFDMGIDQPQIKKSHFWKRSLDFVMSRHELLVRTGAYVHPDPKRVMVGKDNPKLVDILDRPNYEFATEVAGISMDEYNVFMAMFRRQLDDEAKDEVIDYAAEVDDLDEDEDVDGGNGRLARKPKRKTSKRGGRKGR